jgi:hypothetical protein
MTQPFPEKPQIGEELNRRPNESKITKAFESKTEVVKYTHVAVPDLEARLVKLAELLIWKCDGGQTGGTEDG